MKQIKSLISQILLLTFSDSESSVNENEHTQPFKAVAEQKKTWFFVQWVKRSLQLLRKKIKMEMTYEDESFWNFLDFVILPLFSIRKNNCQNRLDDVKIIREKRRQNGSKNPSNSKKSKTILEFRSMISIEKTCEKETR